MKYRYYSTYRCYEVQDHPTPNPLPASQGGGYDVLHNKGICCNNKTLVVQASCLHKVYLTQSYLL
ncbi:MAG: hypothetical protein ACKPER_00575 [Dolichospermum sp.]